jgi:hypothetical protein
MSFHAILYHIMSYHVSLDFSYQLSIKSGRARAGAGSNMFFLGLRRQLCCQAEGKNNAQCTVCENIQYLSKLQIRAELINCRILPRLSKITLFDR